MARKLPRLLNCVESATAVEHDGVVVTCYLGRQLRDRSYTSDKIELEIGDYALRQLIIKAKAALNERRNRTGRVLELLREAAQ